MHQNSTSKTSLLITPSLIMIYSYPFNEFLNEKLEKLMNPAVAHFLLDERKMTFITFCYCFYPFYFLCIFSHSVLQIRLLWVTFEQYKRHIFSIHRLVCINCYSSSKTSK